MKKYEEITQKIEKLMEDAAPLKSIDARSTNEQTLLELLNERLFFEREKLALCSKVFIEIAIVLSKNSQTFRKTDKKMYYQGNRNRCAG